MIVLIPTYDKKLLILQVAVVLLFSVSLYFFLHSIQEKKRVTSELANVASQKEQLQQIRTSVDRYISAVDKNSDLKNLSSDPVWEQVDFKWKSLSFAELIGRIDNLSHQQKLFVMESFTAGLEKQEDSMEGRPGGVQGSVAVEEVEERFYHLRGYFLCPCL